MLQSTILHSYQTHLSQVSDKRIWLACSGGRDSMVLAYATFQLYRAGQLPFCPQLLHVNHGVQSANDQWANMVAEWGADLGIPCLMLKAGLTGKVNENTARIARYQAMVKQMNEGDVLMLAHHANDQVETMLMRLFNGAGVQGLSGMAEWTQRTIPISLTNLSGSDALSQTTTFNRTIHLWRPLLTIIREQITDYAHEHQLPYVDDPTNLTGDNVRSWLRSDLFPTIKQHYPQVINNIIRTNKLMHHANDILDDSYQEDLKSTEIKELQSLPCQKVLDIDKIKSLSQARQSQLIHRWLQGDEPVPASKYRVDEILALVHRQDNDQQTQLDWYGEHHQYSIRRYRHQLYRLRKDWLILLQSEAVWQTAGGKNQLKKQSMLLMALDDSLSYQVRPIHKNDKFSLNPQQKQQSGKKLMQRLGIPNWMRASVQVVVNNQKGTGNGQVLCVFTPIQAWYKAGVLA